MDHTERARLIRDRHRVLYGSTAYIPTGKSAKPKPAPRRVFPKYSVGFDYHRSEHTARWYRQPDPPTYRPMGYQNSSGSSPLTLIAMKLGKKKRLKK